MVTVLRPSRVRRFASRPSVSYVRPASNSPQSVPHQSRQKSVPHQSREMVIWEMVIWEMVIWEMVIWKMVI